MLAKEWLNSARDIMTRIEDTQMENIRKAAEIMADSIEAGRFSVHLHLYDGNAGGTYYLCPKLNLYNV